MRNFIKLENLFLFISILLFISYIIYQNLFWNFLLVPTGRIEFHDLICFFEWERLYENFKDSKFVYSDRNGCPLNYPKIWILISKLFTYEKFFYLLLIVNFILYNYVFYFLIKKHKSLILVYMYMSGSSLLMLERGNLEIFIFILIFLFLISKSYLKIFFLFSSIVLKIFPIFALISILNKKNLYFFITISFLSLLYFFIIIEDLALIFVNTPQTGDMSYGTLAVSINILKHLNIEINYLIISFSLIFIVLLLYFIFFHKFLKNENFMYSEMFLTGAAIFCATFLLNSNHDYRLMFLLFAVPLIVNINNFFLKSSIIVVLIFSLELNRLLYFFGFYGGVLNSLSKILLFILLSQILINILFLNFKNFFLKKENAL